MAVPAAAVASSSASSAGAGAAGGPIALAVVLALVITKEIFKARRTARREMLAKKYPPIQVETAAQRLKNLLGENGEALAVAQILTPEQQMQMGVLQPDFSYSYSEPVSTQQIPRSRQQILQDLGISSTERQQELRAKTGPIQAPGKTNPNWAQDLANILLNITGGNLNKLNKLNPNSLPYNEYYNLMMKVASREVDRVWSDVMINNDNGDDRYIESDSFKNTPKNRNSLELWKKTNAAQNFLDRWSKSGKLGKHVLEFDTKTSEQGLTELWVKTGTDKKGNPEYKNFRKMNKKLRDEFIKPGVEFKLSINLSLPATSNEGGGAVILNHETFLWADQITEIIEQYENGDLNDQQLIDKLDDIESWDNIEKQYKTVLNENSKVNQANQELLDAIEKIQDQNERKNIKKDAEKQIEQDKEIVKTDWGDE